MKRTPIILGIISSLLVFTFFAIAQQVPTHPEKWTRDVKLYNAVRAGATVLPAGEYRIRHEMDGQKHIMIFTRIGKWDQNYRVQCDMVPLAKKAATDEQHVRAGKDGEPELVSLIFKGDDVRHVFVP